MMNNVWQFCQSCIDKYGRNVLPAIKTTKYKMASKVDTPTATDILEVETFYCRNCYHEKLVDGQISQYVFVELFDPFADQE